MISIESKYFRGAKLAIISVRSTKLTLISQKIPKDKKLRTKDPQEAFRSIIPNIPRHKYDCFSILNFYLCVYKR